MSFNDQGQWDGSFFLGQHEPLLTALLMQRYAHDMWLFYGGDDTAFAGADNNGAVGSVDAVTEHEQLQAAVLVAHAMTSNPKPWNDYQATLGPNDMMSAYWHDPQNDIDVAVQNLGNGSGIEDVWNAFNWGGYSEGAAADAICRMFAPPIRDIAGIVPEIRLPSGQGSSRILAQIIRFPFAASFLDPVLFVDQKTGQLSQALTQWAYHIGGEHVSIAMPGSVTWEEYLAGVGYIGAALLVRYDFQAGAILAGFGTSNTAMTNLEKRRKLAVALGQKIKAYADQNYPNVAGQTTGNMISPVPASPGIVQKIAQSTLYNGISLCPPTYLGSFIKQIFAGDSPIVPKGTPNSVDLIDSHGVTTSWAINLQFNMDVCLRFSSEMGAWLDADAGRLYPPGKDVTLRLIDNAYR